MVINVNITMSEGELLSKTPDNIANDVMEILDADPTKDTCSVHASSSYTATVGHVFVPVGNPPIENA